MAETNARKRPIGFVEASTVETDDFLLIDGQTSGTRKIKPDKVGKANTSDLNNDAGFQNATEVAAAIAANIDAGLDTEGKAADSKAVGDALATKVDAASGKGLSTNDYTTAEKTKLAGVATGATRVLIDSGLSESGKAADAAAVGTALETKVTKETGKGLLALDTTLTQTGKAADAKATGDVLKADIAPAYSTSSTYAVGAYVLYNNVLYRCTTAIATAEAWTAAHWTAVNVGSELTQYKQDISELEEGVTALGFSVVEGAICVTYTA